MQDAENFVRQANALRDADGMGDGGNPALRHVLAVRREINAAAKGLADKLHQAVAPKEAFPQEGLLGRQLETVTRILAARVPIVAVKAALGGFDTHANQVQQHERLLGFLATNLAALRRNLIDANLWNDVVVMTYSEFGRRVRENASGGTDHGTAAPLLVMGGGVKGGLHGAYPSLSNLSEDDLRHTVDFRSVFATIAQGCWGQRRDFGLRQPQKLGFLS